MRWREIKKKGKGKGREGATVTKGKVTVMMPPHCLIHCPNCRCICTHESPSLRAGKTAKLNERPREADDIAG